MQDQVDVIDHACHLGRSSVGACAKFMDIKVIVLFVLLLIMSRICG